MKLGLDCTPTRSRSQTPSYLFSLPSRRSPVEGAFSSDGLFETRFRIGNAPNLQEGEQLHALRQGTFAPPLAS